MRKYVVFFLALGLSYVLVQWESGFVLPLLYGAEPFHFVKEETPPFIVRLMPIIVLVLPQIVAYFSAEFVGRRGWKL